MNKTFLGLGSNLEDREGKLTQAIHKIQEKIGIVVSRSSFYDTAPWGFVSSHRFLNAVVEVDTPLTPQELLASTQSIEQALGRKTKNSQSYEDRPIDIDILYYNQMVLKEEGLTIPHPLLQERDFVLRPLLEIAPLWEHPLLHKTTQTLWKDWQAKNN